MMGITRKGKNTVRNSTRRRPRVRDFSGAYKSIGAHNQT